ncbi:molybdenum cofactor guanylyltransferase [Bacillus sp. AK128]
MITQISGIILSGGESRRFGKPKAFATYEGIPFWRHSYHAIKPHTESQVIVSHETLRDQFVEQSNLPVILDDPSVRAKGPMAGIYSGMKELQAEWYVVVSCDIPAINEEVIQKLLAYTSDSVQAVIPMIDGRFQPLVGVYHSSTFQVIDQLLHSNHFRVITMLDQVKTLYVTEKDLQVDPAIFQNINDHDAYDELLKKK